MQYGGSSSLWSLLLWSELSGRQKMGTLKKNVDMTEKNKNENKYNFVITENGSVAKAKPIIIPYIWQNTVLPSH